MTLALALTVSLIATAADAEATAWRTGVDFRSQLAAKVGVKWVDNPLRHGLANLAQSQRTAIFLDRRIDPSRKVTISAEDEPLENILRRIAEQLDLGVSVIDCVVYIGPQPTASKLATLAMLRKDEARKLPPALVKRLAERKPLAWDALATPRELLEQTMTGIPAKAPDLAFFHHDLWPAGDWPGLSAIDRLTLLLAGFDLTFELVAEDKGAGSRSAPALFVRIIEMPGEALARREYRLPSDGAKAADRLASQFPNARIQIAKGKLEVLATADDHATIDGALRGKPVRPRPTAGVAAGAAPPEKRYTLKTQPQPFGKLAKALAGQLELEIVIDSSADAKLTEPVAIEVREATLEELLEALVNPVGLVYEIEGRVLRIKGG